MSRATQAVRGAYVAISYRTFRCGYDRYVPRCTKFTRSGIQPLLTEQLGRYINSARIGLRLVAALPKRFVGAGSTHVSAAAATYRNVIPCL